MARAMVTQFGMSDVGPAAQQKTSQQESAGSTFHTVLTLKSTLALLSADFVQSTEKRLLEQGRGFGFRSDHLPSLNRTELILS